MQPTLFIYFMGGRKLLCLEIEKKNQLKELIYEEF